MITGGVQKLIDSDLVMVAGARVRVVAMVLGFVPDVQYFPFFRLLCECCACNVDEAEQGEQSTQSHGANPHSHTSISELVSHFLLPAPIQAPISSTTSVL